MSTKYTKEEFKAAVAKSKSWAGVARELGLSIYGSTNQTLKRRAKEWGIGWLHFTGQGHLKGKTHSWAKQIPLKEVLVCGRYTDRTKLKARLLKEGLLANRCSTCPQEDTWNGKPLVLILDHINGIADDNRLENLRLLCPNCNSQQPTFAGRNKRKS